MDGLLSIISRTDPGTILTLLALAFGLNRRIEDVRERMARIEPKVDLLLAGHKVVNDAPRISPGV